MVRVYSGIHTPCPCVFWPSRQNFGNTGVKLHFFTSITLISHQILKTLVLKIKISCIEPSYKIKGIIKHENNPQIHEF